MDSRLLNDQKGFTLPLAMVVLAVGVLIVIPFVIGLSLTLLSSRNSQVNTHEQYALDGAYEDVVWDLKYGTLAGSLAEPCDSVSYPLHEKVNGFYPDITVTWASDCGGDDGLDPTTYLISVRAGSSSITREFNDGSVIAAANPPVTPTATAAAIPPATPTATAAPNPTATVAANLPATPTATAAAIPPATPTVVPTPDIVDIVPPTPRELKQRVVDNLSPYVGDSKKYGKRFKKAVKETEKSLDPKLWATKPGNSGQGNSGQGNSGQGNSGKNNDVIDHFRLDQKEGKKDFKHEEKAVKELKELLKGFADEKCGGVTSIALEYTGPGIIMVEAFLKDTLLGTFIVEAEDPDLENTYDSIFEVSATEETGGKLHSEIRLVVGGSEVAKIHTSCSKPIEIGDVHGDFTIDDLEKLPSKDKDKLQVSAESLEFARMAVEDLLNADRMLAQLFLEENSGLVAVNPKKQEKVDKELEKAVKELAKGDAEREKVKTKPDKVVKRYGKTWERVAKAVKESTKK